MSVRRRRGLAHHEFALNVALFLCVATIGWTSPSAFHDAIVGATELAAEAVAGPAVREGVPDMLVRPGDVVIPLWSEPTAVERQQSECAGRGKADPWSSDACATGPSAPGDAKPWASTPWGVE